MKSHWPIQWNSNVWWSLYKLNIDRGIEYSILKEKNFLKSLSYLFARILLKPDLPHPPPILCLDSLPGHSVALCLAVAFKSKATNDEIFSILKDVPNPNQDDDDGKGMTELLSGALQRLVRAWAYLCQRELLLNLVGRP